MIQDLDGGDTAPSRAGLVRGLSVALAFGALLGWAALSSPAIRGPYATPNPAALGALAAPARYTPEPVRLIDAAGDRALQPGVKTVWVSCAVFSTTVFVNGQPVGVFTPSGEPVVVAAPNGQRVAVNAPVYGLAPALRSFCLVPEPQVPFDRFAR